jgi:hypothetical protein
MTLAYLLYLATTAFWIWMIIDCFMNEPDRFMWLLILFFFNLPGALVYFFVRKLPQMKGSTAPKFMNKFMLGSEIRMAQANAHNIDNAYSHAALGDILLKAGKYDEAQIAYLNALKKDKSEDTAMWGAATVALKKKDYKSSKKHLETLLKLDAGSHYGDASLYYTRSLFALGEDKKALSHAQAHLKKWSHPEVSYIYCILLDRNNKKEEAIQYLDDVILDLKGVYSFYYKKNRHWIRRLKSLYSKLKK